MTRYDLKLLSLLANTTMSKWNPNSYRSRP